MADFKHPCIAGADGVWFIVMI